jgi:hypothetical protein
VDLTEGWIDWPEVAVLEKCEARVIEDWEEAELALGHYPEVSVSRRGWLARRTPSM